MKKSYSRRLWGGIELGKWLPARVVELFMTYGSGAESAQDRNDYAKLVMIQVTANFGRHGWLQSLKRLNASPDEVAADLAAHVLRKTPTARARMQHPCEIVVRQYLNTMIFNRMMSIVRNQTRQNAKQPTTGDNGADGRTALDHVPTACAPADLLWLARYLRDHEDEACRGISGDIYAIATLFRYICRRLTRDGEIVLFDKLPERLRDRLHPEIHYLPVVTRIRSLGERAAADAVG